MNKRITAETIEVLRRGDYFNHWRPYPQELFDALACAEVSAQSDLGKIEGVCRGIVAGWDAALASATNPTPSSGTMTVEQAFDAFTGILENNLPHVAYLTIGGRSRPYIVRGLDQEGENMTALLQLHDPAEKGYMVRLSNDGSASMGPFDLGMATGFRFSIE